MSLFSELHAEEVSKCLEYILINVIEGNISEKQIIEEIYLLYRDQIIEACIEENQKIKEYFAYEEE